MAAPARLQEFIDVSPETGVRSVESVDSSGTALLPPAEWPADGRVAFENVSFRYSDGEELVLRDISLKLAPGEKVGVVGPADAGTSSLAMALFRVRELAAGRVLIDGVDAAAVDLTTLRSALAIIPQTPAPVTGSVRGFLDPFDEFTDEHLWLALRRAGLVATVAALDGMLYAALEENGEAFGSAGGRQLLGMARALLSGARVVVLDGAADMDRDTDRRLQQVIRDAFAHATVLTIAHTLCLETVLDADRVLMLGDDGRVADLAAPRTLLARGHGLLYDLAKQGGYLERFAGATAAVETMTTAEEEEEEGDVHRAGE